MGQVALSSSWGQMEWGRLQSRVPCSPTMEDRRHTFTFCPHFVARFLVLQDRRQYRRRKRSRAARLFSGGSASSETRQDAGSVISVPFDPHSIGAGLSLETVGCTGMSSNQRP